MGLIHPLPLCLLVVLCSHDFEELNPLLFGLDVIRWNSHVIIFGFILCLIINVIFLIHQYINSMLMLVVQI